MVMVYIVVNWTRLLVLYWDLRYSTELQGDWPCNTTCTSVSETLNEIHIPPRIVLIPENACVLLACCWYHNQCSFVVMSLYCI